MIKHICSVPVHGESIEYTGENSQEIYEFIKSRVEKPDGISMILSKRSSVIEVFFNQWLFIDEGNFLLALYSPRSKYPVFDVIEKRAYNAKYNEITPAEFYQAGSVQPV